MQVQKGHSGIKISRIKIGGDPGTSGSGDYPSVSVKMSQHNKKAE